MSDTSLDRLDRYCDLRERAIDAAEERGTACVDECVLLGVHELRVLIVAAREAERQYAVVAELRAQLEAMTDIAKRNQERAAWLEAHEEGWRDQHLGDTKRIEALAAFVADFCDTADKAIAAHETGGMRVPYHGDFCSAAPSVRHDLAAWAKRGREVVGTKP